ncbi:MAG: DUF4256 domain-containing protein [Patescibacteria group bacterium]|nr:DUF4256 domain-containing protein [Patescibacteria group bacterium]
MENNRWTDGLTAELDRTEKLTEDGKRLALKAVTSRTPINDIALGREAETDEDRGAVRNGARQEIERIANLTIVKPEQGVEAEAGNSQEVTVEQGEQDKRELPPEQAGRILGALQSRFNANTNLHKGMDWKDVEASLKASPEALWSLAQMESAGHAPDVYHDDESGYYFGTCSLETPESARNCIYDKEAAEWLKIYHPDVQFNGSAVEMAEAMGIALMPPEHYENILQKKGKFDKSTWSWLLTQSNIRSTDRALGGSRCGDNLFVARGVAGGHNDNRGWRGTLRVNKVTA